VVRVLDFASGSGVIGAALLQGAAAAWAKQDGKEKGKGEGAAAAAAVGGGSGGVLRLHVECSDADTVAVAAARRNLQAAAQAAAVDSYGAEGGVEGAGAAPVQASAEAYVADCWDRCCTGPQVGRYEALTNCLQLSPTALSLRLHCHTLTRHWRRAARPQGKCRDKKRRGEVAGGSGGGGGGGYDYCDYWIVSHPLSDGSLTAL
jgi:hypothetical protein